MSDSLLYKLRSGKPPKFIYFAVNMLWMLVPDYIYRINLRRIISQLSSRKDRVYIQERVDYYNKLSGNIHALEKVTCAENKFRYFIYKGAIGDYKIKYFHKAYFFDAKEITRWFKKSLLWQYCPGDVYFTPDSPTIVKSRLLIQNNENSVLMKLDKLRHFMFVDDKIPFTSKKNLAIFRGKIRSRVVFARNF